MIQKLNAVSSIKILPNKGALGAEVLGLDLSHPLPKDIVSLIKNSLAQYSLLIFRSQSLTDDDQLKFTEYFGNPEIHVRDNPDVETPGIFLVSNVLKKGKPIGALGNGEIEFHSDLAYLPKPGLYSTLYAVEVPSEGGLTGFGDLAKAYDALDEKTKALLEKIEVAYTFSMQRRHMRYVDLKGYEPGPYSPRKPSDANFPDFPEQIY